MGTGANCTPSGVLVGHSEGITYVTSKGDNRYLASNGKDQKMLLWDLRKMFSGQDRKLPRIRDTGFDYRQGYYPGRRSHKVPVGLRHYLVVHTYPFHWVNRAPRSN
jgi:WD repeat-containing protein 23